MTRKKAAMSKPPVEMDLLRIEEAIHEIENLAWENSAPHTGPDGQWIGELAQTEIGRVIEHPILAGCRFAHAALHAHLERTIGPAAANAITERINAETGAKYRARKVQPEPAQVRH